MSWPLWVTRHILDDGSIETHEDAEERLLVMMRLPPGDLFDSKDTLIEEAYDTQGARIAYSAGSQEPEGQLRE